MAFRDVLSASERSVGWRGHKGQRKVAPELQAGGSDQGTWAHHSAWWAVRGLFGVMLLKPSLLSACWVLCGEKPSLSGSLLGKRCIWCVVFEANKRRWMEVLQSTMRSETCLAQFSTFFFFFHVRPICLGVYKLWSRLSPYLEYL